MLDEREEISFIEDRMVSGGEGVKNLKGGGVAFSRQESS